MPRGRQLLVPRASAAGSGDTPANTSSAGAAADTRFAALSKVLVAGAAGGTGRCVVQALRAKGVPVRALVRDAAAAGAKLPPAGEGLEIVEGDGACRADEDLLCCSRARAGALARACLGQRGDHERWLELRCSCAWQRVRRWAPTRSAGQRMALPPPDWREQLLSRTVSPDRSG